MPFELRLLAAEGCLLGDAGNCARGVAWSTFGREGPCCCDLCPPWDPWTSVEEGELRTTRGGAGLAAWRDFLAVGGGGLGSGPMLRLGFDCFCFGGLGA